MSPGYGPLIHASGVAMLLRKEPTRALLQNRWCYQPIVLVGSIVLLPICVHRDKSWNLSPAGLPGGGASYVYEALAQIKMGAPKAKQRLMAGLA